MKELLREGHSYCKNEKSSLKMDAPKNWSITWGCRKQWETTALKIYINIPSIAIIRFNQRNFTHRRSRQPKSDRERHLKIDSRLSQVDNHRNPYPNNNLKSSRKH